MSPKGGPRFLMLAVVCAVLATVCPAEPSDGMSAGDTSFIAKKLMMKCYAKGYPVPTKMLLNNVFNNSTLVWRTPDQFNTFQSAFLQILSSVSVANSNTGMTSLGPLSMNPFEKMKSNMWNCSNLPTMIKMMKNSSNPSVCYLEAFIAPLTWAALMSQSENSINSSDYDTLLSAAKCVLLDVPSARTTLPSKIQNQNMEKMMNMLKDVYDTMTEEQRTEVFSWAKDQILQNKFNCTLRKTSDSKSKMMNVCKLTPNWLNLDALNMIGPYISSSPPNDLDSASKDILCDFFSSGRLKFNMIKATRINPSLAKTFLQKIQQCLNTSNVDKLGPLACYYKPPKLTPDLSKRLLLQLDTCDDSITSQLKKDFVASVMSGSNSSALNDLGQYVTSLTPKQLRELSQSSLKAALQNLGSSVAWSPSQLRALAKNQLGDKKCGQVTAEDVMALQSVAAGLSSCVLKNIKAEKILADPAALANITKQMKKGQLKAMLNGLGKNLSGLVEKLSGPLLRSVSLSNLAKANITRLDEVENKTWSLPQAAYLAKKMHDLKKLQYRNRRLNSIVQGITCKMIEEVNDTDTLDMAQALAENPEWLSKAQAGCAAHKLLKSLEQERTDYFKNITEQELTAIPTLLLIHLPPGKVNDLPDSVCQAFLDKMETANLSSLSLRASSRQALRRRALLCLTIGKNMSELTSADVSRLGPLLCEVKPSDLALMDPQVTTFSLQAMASCQHIPQEHRADLIQLLNKTFGNPSNWTADTLELLGPLLLLDDSTLSALPNKPWLKDVLVFLMPRLSFVSEAFRRKCFELTTTTTTASNPARRRRAAQSDSNVTEPTQSLIEEMGPNNVYWTAAQLEMISNTTFQATVQILGSITGYSLDQLYVLQRKAIKVFGPVAQMAEGVVVQLGCITQGFNNSDLEELQLSLDNLDEIAQCGWKDLQIPSVWKGVAKYNNLTAALLGTPEMVQLNRFICGLNSSEISQLSSDAFRDAVGSVRGLQCPAVVLQQLKQLAVFTFGNPNTWTEAQVSDLDNIMAALDAKEMASLDPSLFSFLSKTCISQIPPQVFAALSVDQLEALGPDNSAMVTGPQKANLTSGQLAALARAETGTVVQEGQQTQQVGSGAPELKVEIFTFMKPALFLLIGLLLL